MTYELLTFLMIHFSELVSSKPKRRSFPKGKILIYTILDYAYNLIKDMRTYDKNVSN